MKLDNILIQKIEGKANPNNVILFNDYRFTILTPSLIRIEKGNFCDDATITVFYRNTPNVKYEYKIDDSVIIKRGFRA